MKSSCLAVEEAGKAFALTDKVDLRNNVIYNWQGNSAYGGEAMNVNLVNNYYKPGPATTKHDRLLSIDKNKNEGTEVFDIWGKFYIAGNVVEGRPKVTEHNWTYGVFNQFHSSYGNVSEAEKEAMKLEEPLDINNNIDTHPATVSYNKVLDWGGASFFRDEVDERIVRNVNNGDYSFEGSKGSTNGKIDSQQDVGGWPELNSVEAPQDTSGDGMPDIWKIEKGLDPDAKQANGNDLSTAYDNVEVYINSLVKHITTGQQ